MSEIIECGVNFLSLGRALGIVPPEFECAYDWFQEHEGEVIPSLPYGKNAPKLSSGIKLVAQRGIHSPNYKELASGGAGMRKYVLSIHSQYRTVDAARSYTDRDVIDRGDGTWTLDYCAHAPAFGSKLTDKSNVYLTNNLVDGVPVAVLMQLPDGSYMNYGLAYVERFDPATGMFTLHGPVSAESENADFCSIIPFELLTREEQGAFLAADAGDERKRVVAEQVRREKQAEFRRALMSAYSGKCAVTGTGVPEVLQAAHIDPYRGRKSQLVSNGLLLRSDIHLLYDSHLITVTPKDNVIRIGHSLGGSRYQRLEGLRVATPKDPALKPSDVLLDMHMRAFETVERQYA